NQPLPLLPDLDSVAAAAQAEPAEPADTPLTPDTLAMQDEAAPVSTVEGLDETDVAQTPAAPALIQPEFAPGEGDWDDDDYAAADAMVEELPSGDDLAADLFANEETVLVEAKVARGLQRPLLPDQVAEVMASPAAAPSNPPVVRMQPVQPVQAEPAGIAVANEVETVTEPAAPQQLVILTHMTQAQYLEDAYDKYGIEKTLLDPEPVVGEVLAPIADPVVPVEIELASRPALDMDAVSEVLAAGRPLAAEQPRPHKLIATIDLPDDPEAASPGDAAESLAPYNAKSAPNAVKLLILPYHERENPNNLTQNTGGGEVVTSLYGSQLALDPAVRVMWDSSASVSHDRLVTREEALRLGKLAGADYVVRGQVVEFRRAQSVPSFYSAVISTAVLAAQVFFAEMSGVDVATEVYRVEDGMCVMSRRDRSQQKYVVQAEKTVRRMAKGMAADVALAITDPESEAMDPLIDELSPVTVLTNPK
ncbi:MAG: hypothetical protein LIP23_05245, partial [Planctomycetes bacterium]|nr:hypothetical protein [Planctomycetota bacterium]